jgi:20S proteasome subunit beta 4
MEVSFAITGKGYVIIAADQNASRSIIKMKGDEDKVKILGSHLAMAYSGEPGQLEAFNTAALCLTCSSITGDTVQFAEYVERNLRLQQMRNNHPLRPQAAASWVRRSIADSLRSRSPYAVNILLGGYDIATKEGKLYWMDYLGTQSDVPFAAHGYGSYFALSLLDRHVSNSYSDQRADALGSDTTIQTQTWRKVLRS